MEPRLVQEQGDKMATKKKAVNPTHHHAPKKPRKKKAMKMSRISFSFKTGTYYKDGKQVWPSE
jgi:hypothetical protein